MQQGRLINEKPRMFIAIKRGFGLSSAELKSLLKITEQHRKR